MRGVKLKAHFDLYDYLMKGDLTQNKVLQDDDVIKVAPYTARVEVKGAVKRNAIYEVSNTNRLDKVLQYAGGLGDNANREFVRITRFGKQDKEAFTVTAAEAKNFVLQTGDQLYVDSVANMFKNRVVISGAVYYQSAYSVEKVPTFKDLLAIAKPKEEVFKERAVLSRLQADYTPEIIGIYVDEVLNGQFNVSLRREDSVHLYPYKEIKETFKVQVRGEVNRLDSFYYAKGLQVQDAILMAGG